MGNVLIDFQYAAQALRRNAGFAAAAVAALSLGIAANTAIFPVVNRVLLEPLPYPDPGRLVQFVSKSELGNQNVVSIPRYGIWCVHADVFQSIAAYDTTGVDVNLTDRELPQALGAARVSADYFRLFGAAVVAGRTFSNNEDQPGAHRVAVISENLWRRRFRANPALVGNTVSLDHEPCQVIGVLASRFAADSQSMCGCLSKPIWRPPTTSAASG